MIDEPSGLEPDFPHEFVVLGTAVSLQSSPEGRNRWIERVRDASSKDLPEGHWAHTGRVAVTIYYFPPVSMDGDVDNIVKPIIDAMQSRIYLDDRQVERVVVQKFEPGNIFLFSAPTDILVDAIKSAKPALYVRVSDNPFEELR